VCSQGSERAWPEIYLRHSAYGGAAGGGMTAGLKSIAGEAIRW
jgi:hypothetical protein